MNTQDLRSILIELCEQLTEQGVVRELDALGIQASQPTINRWKRGLVGRPSFALATGILELNRRLRQEQISTKSPGGKVA